MRSTKVWSTIFSVQSVCRRARDFGTLLGVFGNDLRHFQHAVQRSHFHRRCDAAATRSLNGRWQLDWIKPNSEPELKVKDNLQGAQPERESNWIEPEPEPKSEPKLAPMRNQEPKSEPELVWFVADESTRCLWGPPPITTTRLL